MRVELHIDTDRLNKFYFTCRQMDTAKRQAEKLMAELGADNATVFNSSRCTSVRFADGKWGR